MKVKGKAQPVKKMKTKLITANVQLNIEEMMFALQFLHILHILINGEIAFNSLVVSR